MPRDPFRGGAMRVDQITPEAATMTGEGIETVPSIITAAAAIMLGGQ